MPTRHASTALLGAVPRVACGWVLDLRDNAGGNRAPMLEGLRPFLGADTLGTFEGPPGTFRTRWTAATLGVTPPDALAQLARSTRVALVTQPDALVTPLAAHPKVAVRGSGYVHLDATPVDVCDPARPARAREATLRAYRARSADPAVEGLVWFEYQPSKSPAHPRAVLRDYRGVLQTDGVAGLDALGASNAVVHLGCWAHARRRFIQALRLGESRAGPLQHARRRGTLHARATADGLVLPPKSTLGQAVGYLLAQRAPPTRCVTTPGARLDNNAVENAIRPLKLGAKNWLFVGHPDASSRLASLFTLVENARQAAGALGLRA